MIRLLKKLFSFRVKSEKHQKQKAENIRNELREYWHSRVLSFAEVESKIYHHHQRHLKDISEQGHRLLANHLKERYEKTKPRSVKYQYNFLFAGNETGKREFIDAIAREHGLELARGLLYPEYRQSKAKLRELSRAENRLFYNQEYEQLEYHPKFYSLDVALGKLIDMKKVYGQDYKVMASDVVYICNDSLLSRPNGLTDAKLLMESLSGKTVTISSALSFYIPLPSGRSTILTEGVHLEIPIKQFTHRDIEEYLSAFGNNILNIPGAIDYSHPSAQKLVDHNKRVIIKPIHASEHVNLNVPVKEIDIEPKLLPHFKDYLFGVPQEVISYFIKQGRAIQAT